MLTEITRQHSHAICRHFSAYSCFVDCQPENVLFPVQRVFEKAVTDAHLLATECNASAEFAQKCNRKRKTFHD